MTARYGDGIVDFAGLLAVWLLVGLEVGTSVTPVFEAAGVVAGTRPLQTPLVVGGVVVAGLEPLDCRPTVAKSLAFVVVSLVLDALVIVPTAIVLEASWAVALLDVTTLGAAVWVVFAGGHRRLRSGAHQTLVRLAGRPRSER